MTKRRYEEGDTVRHKDSGYVGTVVSGNDVNGYSVRYPCDDEEYHVSKDEIVFVDAKSVFLARLQSLLRGFDASFEMDVDHGYDMDLRLYVGGEYNGKIECATELTASNIMDFEKE